MRPDRFNGKFDDFISTAVMDSMTQPEGGFVELIRPGPIRRALLFIASNLFHPTALQRGMGYVAWINVPLVGWVAMMDSSGKIWWRW